MIIGIKEKDRVVLAYSSFDGFSPVNVADLANAENLGLWKIKGNPHTVMGCVFPSAESDAFRYEEGMFKGEINYDKLADEIIPAMEDFAKDKEYIGDDKGRYDEFLIAQKGRLFQITAEHIITEIDSTVATSTSGRCEDIAQSILYATQGEPTIDRIKKAFGFAACEVQYNPYPISVIDTQTGKVLTLTKE